jgi:TetR/AcrR family transcriptional regulator, transcriptional repressor for nem operon
MAGCGLASGGGACYEPTVKQRKKQPMVTRQAILDSAGIEFSMHGYAASGIGTVVARAGVTKGAVFHHFPDKEALAVAWIGDALAPAIHSKWITPLPAVDALDEFKDFCRARCLEMRAGDPLSALVSLSMEVSAGHPAISAPLEVLLTNVRDAFASLLERGKSAAWIHRSVQPAVEGAFLMSVFCGFSVTTRCRDDAQARATCATAVETYLDTLRPA